MENTRGSDNVACLSTQPTRLDSLGMIVDTPSTAMESLPDVLMGASASDSVRANMPVGVGQANLVYDSNPFCDCRSCVMANLDHLSCLVLW